jgi:hypothetical protein
MRNIFKTSISTYFNLIRFTVTQKNPWQLGKIGVLAYFITQKLKFYMLARHFFVSVSLVSPLIREKCYKVRCVSKNNSFGVYLTILGNEILHTCSAFFVCQFLW